MQLILTGRVFATTEQVQVLAIVSIGYSEDCQPVAIDERFAATLTTSLEIESQSETHFGWPVG